MNYLLDSDVIISFLKNREPGVSLIQKIIGKKVFISIISWTEIVYGVKKSGNPAKRMREFKKFLELSRITVLAIDERIGEQFVKLKVKLEKKGKRLADFDLLIASTAMICGLNLVTGNKKHFSRIKTLKIF